MIIGYTRVSSGGQKLDRQIDLLKEQGAEIIYEEIMTGVNPKRPELEKLKIKMRKGDTVMVESLSRLGRSTKDLLKLMEEFDEAGVTVVSLKESIDTKTPTGRLILTFISALSQFERDLIVQRTKEGLEAARARGRGGGRPKKDPEVLKLAVSMYKSRNYTVDQIIKKCGISRGRLYQELSALNEQKTN